MDPFKYLLKLNPAKIKMGLQRTHDLLKACGNPEKDLLSIQVVGTNGKDQLQLWFPTPTSITAIK